MRGILIANFSHLKKVLYYSNIPHFIPYICGITMTHNRPYCNLCWLCPDVVVWKLVPQKRVQKLHLTWLVHGRRHLLMILLLLVERSQGTRQILQVMNIQEVTSCDAVWLRVIYQYCVVYKVNMNMYEVTLRGGSFQLQRSATSPYTY